MTFEEYKVLSEKTLSAEFHCGEKEQRLMHAVMGIITEIEEVSNSKDDLGKKDEIADIFWYIAIICREYNISLINQSQEEISLIKQGFDSDRCILNLFKDSALLLDFLKKKLYYNKEINEDKFVEVTNKIIFNCQCFSILNNIDIYKSLENNIAKLKSRYGSKFSSDKAINRDLESERKILEKGNE